MDFTNAVRPVTIGNAYAPQRADIVASQSGVAVELPPERTVQSAEAGDAVQVDLRARTREEHRQAADRRQAGINEARQERRAQAETVERRLVIEPKTRSVVLQKSNSVTGEVVETIPDEATLRQRIYAHVLAEARAREAQAGHGRMIRRSA